MVSNNTEIRSTKRNAFVVFGGPARTVDLDAIAGDGVRVAGAPRNFFGLRASGGGDFTVRGLHVAAFLTTEPNVSLADDRVAG